MKIKIAYSLDPTGMDKDIVEVIELPTDLCLFDYFDTRGFRLRDVVMAHLIKEYGPSAAISLLKVYAV